MKKFMYMLVILSVGIYSLGTLAGEKTHSHGGKVVMDGDSHANKASGSESAVKVSPSHVHGGKVKMEGESHGEKESKTGPTDASPAHTHGGKVKMQGESHGG